MEFDQMSELLGATLSMALYGSLAGASWLHPISERTMSVATRERCHRSMRTLYCIGASLYTAKLGLTVQSLVSTLLP